MTVRESSPSRLLLVGVAGALLAACSTPSPAAAPDDSTASTASSPTVSPSPSGTTASPTATPTPTPTPTPAGPVTSCPTTVSTANLKACIRAARTAYTDAWADQIASTGASVTLPSVVVFRAVPTNPCVDGSVGDVATASFWCGENNTVYVARNAAPYWTVDYARNAAEAGVLASDAADTGVSTARLRRGFQLAGAATEFAHELGHWVQESTGQMAWYQERIDSDDFDVSNGYKVANELAADCMAGWVQGRTARDGTWRARPIDRWAQHATMAELGADMSGIAAGFTFPRESDLIAYGGPYSRLRFYDLGYAAGLGDGAGLTVCATEAAVYTDTSPPPGI